MAKSRKKLDVNIVLLKCEFIGVAAFQSTNKSFVKMQYFQSMLQAEPNTLKESSTFKGKCAVNAENFICDL